MTWVLLRGLSRSSLHWGGFPKLLAASYPGQVISLDLPGFGVRCQEQSPRSIAAIADDIWHEINRRNLGSIGLVGISLGGMVATELAARHPLEIDRLVLINSSNRKFGRLPERLRPRASRVLMRALMTGEDVAREKLIFSVTSNRPELEAEAVAEWVDIHLRYPARRMAVWNQLIAANRFEGYSKPPIPNVLVIVSAMDRLVSMACSNKQAAKWEVPLREHPTAGHDLSLDAPDWLVQQIRGWQDALPVVANKTRRTP